LRCPFNRIRLNASHGRTEPALKKLARQRL
jgi:hypothetical protein